MDIGGLDVFAVKSLALDSGEMNEILLQVTYIQALGLIHCYFNKKSLYMKGTLMSAAFTLIVVSSVGNPCFSAGRGLQSDSKVTG